MPDQPAEPTLPESARTALARARVGSLVTKGCTLRPSTLTVVAIEAQPDGCPVVHLDESSSTVWELGACRVATVSVAGISPFRRLELTGPLLRQRESRPGERSFRFRLSPLTVRLVGSTSRTVGTAEFQAARPDPFTTLAPTVIEHLAHAYAAEMLAWVRAHGHENAQAILPRSVDRYGIDLAVLDASGVQQMRLVFPGGPIQHVDEARSAWTNRPSRGEQGRVD